MAEDAVNRIGAMLEELSARFELVIEAVSGYGGRLDALRQELFGQFAEVGGQIRFLSDQIAENRRGITSLRSDLGAEMVRLGETLGKTRVEFREQIGASEVSIRRDIGDRAEAASESLRKEAKGAAETAGVRIGQGVTAVGREISGEVADNAKTIKREIAAAADSTAKKLSAEITKTNKALANLARKFDRFDDRVTIETRDQDQRLRKLERKSRAS